LETFYKENKKMKKIIFAITAFVFLLSACSPEPEPTMSVEEIQGTAVAAAFTMIAQTQAAMPTPTASPLPPTETPVPTLVPPTNTVVPLEAPTQQIVVQPSPTTASNKDECDKFLSTSAAGPTAPIRIVNYTKAPVNVSLYLEKTPFGECGYRGYSISKNGSINIEFPQGVIYAYAWILEPINTTVSGGPWVPNNPDKWTIEINENFMKMVGP
jgi:hypothetical protein